MTPAPGQGDPSGKLAEPGTHPTAPDCDSTQGDKLDESSEPEKTLKQDLHDLVEYFSVVCDLRFREVGDVSSFIAAKAYLRATKEALGTAKAALDAI